MFFFLFPLLFLFSPSTPQNTSTFLPIFPIPLQTPTAGEVLGSLVYLQIGVPLSPFPLFLDGGYDWVMVNNLNCTSLFCGNGPKYDPSQSNASQDTNVPFQSSYGFGIFSAKGEIFQDQFTYQPTSTPLSSSSSSSSPSFSSPRISSQTPPPPSLTVSQESFVSIFSYSSIYPPVPNLPSSGGLGLSYPSSPYSSLSFLSNLFVSNQITSQIFSLLLPRSYQEEGSFWIGEQDPSFPSESIIYTPLLKSTWATERDYDYWTSKFENVVVGGQPIMKCGTVASPCNFFIDPAGGGLSLSNFPDLDVDPTCQNINLLPDINITIDSHSYILTPNDYVIQNSTGQCYSTVISLPPLVPNILGYTWLRTYFTVFDVDHKQMGFSHFSNQK